MRMVHVPSLRRPHVVPYWAPMGCWVVAETNYFSEPIPYSRAVPQNFSHELIIHAGSAALFSPAPCMKASMSRADGRISVRRSTFSVSPEQTSNDRGGTVYSCSIGPKLMFQWFLDIVALPNISNWAFPLTAASYGRESMK